MNIVQAQGAGTIDETTYELLAFLKTKVEAEPRHADSWRILGNTYRKLGQLAKAAKAYELALSIEPDGVAIHHDMGVFCVELELLDEARTHFEQVFKIAPDSDYAKRLIEQGLVAYAASEVERSDQSSLRGSESESASPIRSYTDPSNSPFEAVATGYEVQTYDNSSEIGRRIDQVDQTVNPERKSIRAVLESGFLYNSNVSSTPISQQLLTPGVDSFQFFINPDLEWRLVEKERWRMGPLLRGYYSFNEPDANDFDLVSIQPGSFVERDFWISEKYFIARLDYLYSHSTFGGSFLGDQHSVTPSLTSLLDNGDFVYLYSTFSHGQFVLDGVPQLQSQDGTIYSLGVARYFFTDWLRVPSWSLGSEWQYSNVEGADFRYQSGRVYGDGTLHLAEHFSFIGSWGLGYRGYPDYTGTVNRDELTWRLAGRLQYQVNSCFSLSGVFNYDRFKSGNEQFDIDRTTTGIVGTYRY